MHKHSQADRAGRRRKPAVPAAPLTVDREGFLRVPAETYVSMMFEVAKARIEAIEREIARMHADFLGSATLPPGSQRSWRRGTWA